MAEIIGRYVEKERLKKILNSNRPEFVAVYGRRRVGKTFLVNEYCKDKIVFRHTGLSPYDDKKKVTTKDQLQNFYYSLKSYGMEESKQPESWLEAFFMLRTFLENRIRDARSVVFIDELPWMDTHGSKFLTALESFWNGWGNSQDNLCLIVCGSATSWMLDHLINNKGGLYNRLTDEIKLSPFRLKECEDFYHSRGIKMSRYNILQSYMVMGGIPYYMNLCIPKLSLAQNIDKLFFEDKAQLGDEFDRLFHSVFDNAEKCMQIIRILGKRHAGYTREELIRQSGMCSNGDFTHLLKSLESSDIIVRYVPFGRSKREVQYKLADNFCWFWLHFKEQKQITARDYWTRHLDEGELTSWRGVAFEEVCFNHIPQIKSALGVLNVLSEESTLILPGDEEQKGIQIDMLISRSDNVINLCEMKYSKAPFEIDKAYESQLRYRQSQMEKKYPRKTIHLTMISTYGIVENSYAETVQSVVTMDDLFSLFNKK